MTAHGDAELDLLEHLLLRQVVYADVQPVDRGLDQNEVTSTVVLAGQRGHQDHQLRKAHLVVGGVQELGGDLDQRFDELDRNALVDDRGALHHVAGQLLDHQVVLLVKAHQIVVGLVHAEQLVEPALDPVLVVLLPVADLLEQRAQTHQCDRVQVVVGLFDQFDQELEHRDRVLVVRLLSGGRFEERDDVHR